MTVTTSELRKGLIVILDGEMYRVTDWAHNKQGRGSAQVRLSLKNVRSGSNIERSFQAGSKFDDVRMERRPLQFQYEDGGDYNFMDPETYDQVVVPGATLGDARNYIKEGDTVDFLMYQDEVMDVDLPAAVVLKVTQSEPGVKGDTATGATKQAHLETGLTVNVPLFVNEGDSIKVDTRSGKYLERA